MLQFIAANIFMISLGAILYVMVRTLPRIEESAAAEKKGAMERWIASEMPEKIDAALNNFLVKFLRKVKVLLLKVDNSLSGHLRKIKPEASVGLQKPAIDFKEISSSKNGGTVAKRNVLGDNQ